MEEPLIEFRDVTKQFNGKTVFAGINLKIFDGQTTAIIGKSGSGKSVLLKHIIGLISQDSGSILFRGREIGSLSRREKKQFFNQVSYMFQNNALFDSMTVYENIAFPLQQTTDLGETEIREKVQARLEQTDLADMGKKYPTQLSGGMQKRVALARALVTDPSIVLFDEPTTGQDIVRRNAILGMIREYQKKYGFTAIIISHDIPDIFFISNRVLVLHEGRIVFEGTPEELDEFEHPYVDEFIASIEGFQEQLTGLYSRRTFKMRYQGSLRRKNPDEIFVVIVLTLPDIGMLCNVIGHTDCQQLIKAFGNHINKHFGAIGGFSARQKRNQFFTVLPFSNISEAETSIAEFAVELKEEGLEKIRAAGMNKEQCVEFSVQAGFAEGRSDDDDIFDAFRRARAAQKEIARLHCI